MHIKATNKTIKTHKEEANEIETNLNTLTTVVENNFNNTNTKYDNIVAKINERLNVNDTDNNARFGALAKDLEKMKFELSDVIDSKFEYIIKSVET
jgi:hypothetical protein